MPKRDNLYAVYDFDSSVCNKDVHNELNDLGVGPRKIYWVNDTLFYVYLEVPEDTCILEDLCENKGGVISSEDHVFTYKIKQMVNYFEAQCEQNKKRKEIPTSNVVDEIKTKVSKNE